MTALPHPLILFFLALALALTEIEIEGRHGWAERTATWYRTRGPAARLWALLTNGKPLTGYHLWLGLFLLLVFHLPFAVGAHWTFSAELSVLATFLVWTTIWDFLWFILNPSYGIRRFQARHIWWHRRWVGPVPLDYLFGLVTSALLAALAGTFATFGASVVWFALLTVIAALIAPWYHGLRRRLGQHDDRPRAGINRTADRPLTSIHQPVTDDVPKDETEWKRRLTPEQYAVLRQRGTEPPFSGALLHVEEAGVFRCAGCGAPLFSSAAKYDSGSGWPSFFKTHAPDSVHLAPDDSLGMRRTEVTCARCGGHLGHLFDDGPQPTGQRYCINSAALTFRER